MDGDSPQSLDDFAALLSQADQPEQPEADSGPDQDEQAEGDTEATAEATDTPEEGEQKDAEAADDQDGQPEQGPADDAVVKWTTAQGEAFEASISELKNGYMRDADYRQKTQALADDRKAAAQHVQQQLQELEALAPEIGAVTALQQQLQQYQQLDWQAIRAADAQQHSALFADYMLLKDRASEAAQRLHAKRQQFAQAQQQAFAQATQEAAEHLQRIVPNFGADTLKQMHEAGLKLGFTAQELAQVADKRVLETLWKAAQWDALQARKPEVHNKVKKLPPKAKPSTSAPRTTKHEQVAKVLKSRETFSTDEFAALLAATRN